MALKMNLSFYQICRFVRCNRGTNYAQFCKQVKRLPDTLEEACKYYQEINPRD